MNISQTLKKATELLKNKKIDNPFLDSSLLLSSILKKDRSFLIAYSEKKLTQNQAKKFWQQIKKRANHFPLAYLLKKKSFYGREFFVNQKVLIPRPETELLVSKITDLLKKESQLQTIAEIGTGSGALIISLSLENNGNKHQWLAVEKSSSALKVAQKNSLKFKTKISFFHGNLTTPIKNKKVDIVVANLPYLDKKIKNEFVSSGEKSLLFEPAMALYAPNKGIGLYQKLFCEIKKLKEKPHYLFLEIGHDQDKILTAEIKKIFPQAQINTQVDYQGYSRILEINFKKKLKTTLV